MNIGKIYEIKKGFWLLYPFKGEAVAYNEVRSNSNYCTFTTRNIAELVAGTWSIEFKCNISYIPQNSIFCLLEQDERYAKILTINGELGWIVISKLYKDDIKEVTIAGLEKNIP